MHLIVGLGNPGRRYAKTRHNVGFRVAERLASRWQIELSREKFHGVAGDGTICGRRIVLLKPMTYMNRSGQSVAEAVGFYKVELSELFVVIDDLALPLGQLRARVQGSAGGHRGLQDVISRLGTEAFSRLRIGIRREGTKDAVSHVLGRFGGEEQNVIDRAVDRGADATECWLSRGIAATMNEYNRAAAVPGSPGARRDENGGP